MSDSQETTSAIGHGVRRLCIAVDLEHYSQRSDAGQIEAQRAMSALLRRAGEHGALERALWLIQPQGDGELALLPPGIDEAYVITSLMQQVSSGLHEYNRFASHSARLRMRIAVHEGVTYVADSGFAGDAINTVCRLRDAAEAKRALNAAAGDVVLIVSARIYQDVICGNDTYVLPPGEFRPVRIEMPDKGFRAEAYIYAGGQAAGKSETGPAQAAGKSAASSPQAQHEDAAGGGAVFHFAGNPKIDKLAGRDINEHNEYHGDVAGRDVVKPVYRVRDE
jgi:hypothetical protein